MVDYPRTALGRNDKEGCCRREEQGSGDHAFHSVSPRECLRLVIETRRRRHLSHRYESISNRPPIQRLAGRALPRNHSDRAADQLNAEAEDVLEYQALGD
jgi:hypothetical protein